ncbi:MAG TPA: Hpt domain-containing protein, partial [Xanthobacteraceae bacterium]|nr:Hpt domain-containing protein [Xanthobacteraceae bacterium]
LLTSSSKGDSGRMHEVAHAIAGTAAWFQLRAVADAAVRLQQALEQQEGVQASVRALSAAIERAIAQACSLG